MADIDDVLRRNPQAAAAYKGVKQTIEVLTKLREAGIAKGDQTRPLRRNSALGSIRPSRRMIGKLKISK